MPYRKQTLKGKFRRLDKAVKGFLEWMLRKSDTIKKVIEQIKNLVCTDFSVIFQRETGSGKSYIARVIHDQRKRSQGSFVVVDLGAIPETLVESELFGYEKGVFTEAEKRKVGLLEIANNGTIFVVDLENITPYVQSKLLRVVEGKRFFPSRQHKTC